MNAIWTPRRQESPFAAPTLKIEAKPSEAYFLTYRGGAVCGDRRAGAWRSYRGPGACDKTTRRARESGHDIGRETKSTRVLEQSGGGGALGHRAASGQLSSPRRGWRDCRPAGQTDSVPTL